MTLNGLSLMMTWNFQAKMAPGSMLKRPCFGSPMPESSGVEPYARAHDDGVAWRKTEEIQHG